MNAALSAQKARTLTEVGVGSTRLVAGVAPPPQSPYWRAVAQPAGFWASAALNPSFRSAYNASAETRVMGTMRPILWRCWRANGIWYATSRGSASAVPTLFQYLPPMNANERAGGGLKGVPEGLGWNMNITRAPVYDTLAHAIAAIPTGVPGTSWTPATQADMAYGYGGGPGSHAGAFTVGGRQGRYWTGHLNNPPTGPNQPQTFSSTPHMLVVFGGRNQEYVARKHLGFHLGLHGAPEGLGDVSQFLDDDGYFDPHKCGMGSTATTDVDLQRWAQLPVQPDAASPLWRTMTSTELALQDKILGWDSAVATAQTHGQRMFKFKGSWYRADRNGFSVLTGGSGRSGHRGLQGVAAAGGGPHVKYGPTSGVSGVYGVGQTNSSFVPPTATERANLLPGDPLVNATQAMLTTFAANGVPSEHADSPVVRAFQVAFNADPLSNLHGSNGKLSVDGGYGPNSHDAAAVIAGSAVPDVNTAPAPVATVTPTLPTAPSSSSTSTTTSSSSSTSSYTKPLIIGALVLGAGVVTAAVLTHKKKGGKRKYRVVAPMRQLRE
jgi:hypothetical protein